MTGAPNPLKWTSRQIDVLRLLAEADGPLYGTEIAQKANVPDKSVYDILDRLRVWHLVAEVNGPTMYPITRRRYFAITSTGRREVAKRCGTDVPRETQIRRSTMTTETIPDTCDSGNALSHDGEGLCQRPATKKVRITGSRSGKAVGTYKMCDGCAAHWTLVSPRTVAIIGDLT